VGPVAPAASAAAVAVVAAGSLTPVAARLARRLGVMDRPETAGYKRQPAPVPVSGGLPVAVSVGLGTWAGHLVAPEGRGPTRRTTTALALATAAGALGVADDVRPLPWPPRLGATAGLGLVGWFSGFRFADLAGPGGAIATVLWTSGTVNAFNLIDNMDGVAASTTTIAAAALAVLAGGTHRPGPAIAGASLAGAAAGFRLHNRFPARVYLGDGGALFVGATVALLALEITSSPGAVAHWAAPVVIVGLPLFDTAFVTVTRLGRNQSPFRGGRDHTAHRLAALGLSVPSVGRVLTGVAATLGAAGLVVAGCGRAGRAVTLGVVAATAAAAGGALARIPARSPAP
jgi:UDP-GlcNAc:undecaprenyl-phosphate/decaprenyl-phosphate GlcNAc-1-phosphate transferase